MGVGQRHAPTALPPGKTRYPLYEGGWAPGPVWISAETLDPTGIRSPDRPARSESLYRLQFLENVCTPDLYRKFRLRKVNTVPPPPPMCLGNETVKATATNQPKESAKQSFAHILKVLYSERF
jgi:hypothetical protein